MGEVVLVRHGETEWNARGVFQGWADIALATRGREQAAAVGVTLDRLVERLSKNVPGFVQYFCDEQGMPRPGE